MAQPDSSIMISGNSKGVQAGGSDGATTSESPSSSSVYYGATTSESTSSSSIYNSARSVRLSQMRREYPTDLEFEIESSKDHWSQLPPMTDDSELLVQDSGSVLDHGVLAGTNVRQPDRDFLDRLISTKDYSELDRYLFLLCWVRFPHRFIIDGEIVCKVGRKIGEGAQAEIYEAVFRDYCDVPYICKVFKKGFYLRDLQKLWPKKMVTGYSTLYTCPIRKGILLQDGRFALLMPRYWGDLRKLLDQRMQQRPYSNCPPLLYCEAVRSMECIAKGMRDLHIANIVHRDLKASNVLVEFIRNDPAMGIGKALFDPFYCRVADFESSAGVVGTTFWRAPEILLALKNRAITPDLFTQQSDVYSYGMTCYEILTGCIPFEEVSSNNYDVVLGGARPELPSRLDSWIRKIVKRCWHADPLGRPTFQEICLIFEKMRNQN